MQKITNALEKTNKALGSANVDLKKSKDELSEKSAGLKTANVYLEKLNIDLKRLTDDLEKSNTELKKSKVDLEKLQKERSLFFASLSHELRTPLNAILGFSKILEKRIPNQAKVEKEYVESIGTSGRSLLRLVNSVHDFTKIELNELKVEKKKCNLKELIKSIALYFQFECEYKGLSFELDMNESFPSWVETDELAIKQVLDNLLNNALKFTTEGHIKLMVRAKFNEKNDLEDSYLKENKVDVTIEVEDTGFGMDHKRVDLILNPSIRPMSMGVFRRGIHLPKNNK